MADYSGRSQERHPSADDGGASPLIKQNSISREYWGAQLQAQSLVRARHESPSGVEEVGGFRVADDRLLSTTEASALLRLSPRTLEDWRLRGGGPPFRKLGRRIVRYLLSDLTTFIGYAARANTG